MVFRIIADQMLWWGAKGRSVIDINQNIWVPKSSADEIWFLELLPLHFFAVRECLYSAPPSNGK